MQRLLLSSRPSFLFASTSPISIARRSSDTTICQDLLTPWLLDNALPLPHWKVKSYTCFAISTHPKHRFGRMDHQGTWLMRYKSCLYILRKTVFTTSRGIMTESGIENAGTLFYLVSASKNPGQMLILRMLELN